MAIDFNLLVSAPILQDLLRDKDTGLPLRSGVVTFYTNDDHTILKNWYFQDPANPANFLAGPNPMTLTGIGTFADQQGNDVIPFFYPFNENNQNEIQTYFIRVENSSGVLQFTRSNFPLTNVAANTGLQTLDNYIWNNVFWRNINSINLTSPGTNDNTIIFNLPDNTPNNTYHYSTLAPSYHDGFAMPDFIVLRDQVGASDSLTFQKFPAGSSQVLTDDITPEYYLEWKCTAAQAGQQLKCLQFPLQLHLTALENQQATIVFHANNQSSTTNIQVSVQILQFTGSGISGNYPTNCTFIPFASFNLTPGWTKYQSNAQDLPSALNIVTANNTGDDALYIQFVFPETDTFDIFFAKPQLYLGSDISGNEYQTYDLVDSIITTPRTGDIRTSLNSYVPFGWVPMNDGTIGSPSSNATVRANNDAWPLFNLIWNKFNPGLGLTSPYIPIYTSSATLPLTTDTFGATPVADWAANKQLSLTKMLGRMLTGTTSGMPIPISFSTNGTTTFTVTSGSLVGIMDATPLVVLTYGGAPAPTPTVTYYIKILSATKFRLYSNAALTLAVTAGSSSTGTLQIPDGVIGQFVGANFGVTSSDANGYPPEVTSGATAILTRPPEVYMNFFMRL